MTATAQRAIETSRRLILDEIGDPPDLTLVRGLGNRGDDLIWAGAQALLADRIYRETDIDGLCGVSGHTLVLCGGGMLCRPYHEWMPRALAVGCLRFDRVILLPSSFDPSEDAVREALASTRATIFAREAESFRRIVSLCDARLAHDCAFFFDFEPFRADGEGTLNAFREDTDELRARPLPQDNEDISIAAPAVDEWLHTIARHELVRTDRAHVMIAGAMLGKTVEFAPCGYHKVEAIAQYALSDYPVARIAGFGEAPEGDGPCPGGVRQVAVHRGRAADGTTARVTAIILARDRVEQALRAVESVGRNSIPVQTLVLDNNSGPAAARVLRAGCEARDGVRLERSDRNLRCAGGRQRALEQARTEFVLFLDDDAEVEPGALDILVADLDAHPNGIAVTATVLLEDGRIQHSGGWMRVTDQAVEFGPFAEGERPDSGSCPPSGPIDWVPGTAVLVRREAFDEFPLDPQMTEYEDNEWSYRIEAAHPGSFRRSLEARAIHHRRIEPPSGAPFALRSAAVEHLHAHAVFYRRHGRLSEVREFDLVPELRDLAGQRDLLSVRTLMELLLGKGTDWTFMEWMNGNLDVLLSAGSRRAAAQAELDQRSARISEQDARIAEQSVRIAQQERTIAEQSESLRFMLERHQALGLVEASLTWRLHERVLPLLSAILWLRDRLRRS